MGFAIVIIIVRLPFTFHPAAASYEQNSCFVYINISVISRSLNRMGLVGSLNRMGLVGSLNRMGLVGSLNRMGLVGGKSARCLKAKT